MHTNVSCIDLVLGVSGAKKPLTTSMFIQSNRQVNLGGEKQHAAAWVMDPFIGRLPCSRRPPKIRYIGPSTG